MGHARDYMEEKGGVFGAYMEGYIGAYMGAYMEVYMGGYILYIIQTNNVKRGEKWRILAGYPLKCSMTTCLERSNCFPSEADDANYSQKRVPTKSGAVPTKGFARSAVPVANAVILGFWAGCQGRKTLENVV